MKKFPSMIGKCVAHGAVFLGGGFLGGGLLGGGLLGGCSASVASSGSELALIEIDPALLEGAADGCEGLLVGDERFVSDAHALVVAVRGERAICRDTEEAIAIELDAASARIAADLRRDTRGIDPRGEELHIRPVYALGDPNPEPGQPGGQMQGNGDLVAIDHGPSLTDEPIALGDPNPEPGVRTHSSASLHQKNPLERVDLP